MAITLGAMLRAERKKRNLTTYDVAGGTRVMQGSIQALEEDDYQRLPAPGYVRGYILSYCRYLRLDPEPFLRQYEIDTGNVRQTTIDDLTLNHTAVEKAHDQHDIPWRTALIIGLVLLVVVAGVFLLLNARGRAGVGASSLTPLPSQETTAAGNSKPATSPPPTQGSVPDATEQLATAPFSFTVRAKDGAASKLTVVCDGVQAYSGSFTSGMKQTFSAQKTATLSIANPMALTITRDAKPVKIPTKAPATVTLRATSP
ncbi:MAG: helix-turn-helix domain-containing protein [Actinomycetia bacterium]|nr:helix-turn-helix domain-containing protein [Actinomycetes bacterium]